VSQILGLAADLALANVIPRVAWMMLILVFGASAGTSPSRGQELVVDLQLVLAADVSSSMDDDEVRLQRDGFAAAFRDPDIIQAIVSGPSGRIAVTYFEWSGRQNQNVIVPWTVIDSADSANALASAMSELSVTRIRLGAGRTSVGAALQFGESLLVTSGFNSERRVIDISADGVSNTGPEVEPVRDAILAAGIVINGLPILIGSDMEFTPFAGRSGRAFELVDFFRDSVIGGPGSFFLLATSVSSFYQSLRHKLITEIVGLQPRIPEQPG
jgi:hypothetical protein